jgi:hypothetical protein
MGDSDARIPISELLRDELRARKRGDETYNDVIERLLSGDSGGVVVKDATSVEEVTAAAEAGARHALQEAGEL